MFDILDRLSWAGSADRPNEDASGAAGDFAWVIDTSIFPGTPSILHEASDAAWLAGFADGRLHALAPTAADGPTLVRRVMREARDAFLAVAPEDRRDPLTWPLGAMTLVRNREGILDVWTFADTTAYVRHPDGSVMSVGEAPALRRLEAASAAGLLRLSGATPREITKTKIFRDWLAERRGRQREDQGPAVLGLDPNAADRLRHQTMPYPSGTVVLLTSDGFSALVDLYGRFDADKLVACALQSGLESLAREARRIETEVDPSGALYPRFKESDDTTALLVRAR
jgi:hypothetical protein